MSENPFSMKNTKKLPDEAFAYASLDAMGKQIRVYPHHLPNGNVDSAHLRQGIWMATLPLQRDTKLILRDNPILYKVDGIKTLGIRKAVIEHLYAHAEELGISVWQEAFDKINELMEEIYISIK